MLIALWREKCYNQTIKKPLWKGREYSMNQLFYREIKPEGWLKNQLKVQANGLGGHLHEIWPDVRDSAWIGGSCEGWERVPYWLDGFIPLSHLLQDEEMIAVANRYVYSIVERQQEDGWICPCTAEKRSTYDAWAVLLIGKVLALHCEFVHDEAVETALYRTMKNLHDLLEKGEIKLFDWGKFRWYEGFVPLIYLYERKPEDWMISLGKLLREQGADYPSFRETWKRPMNEWTFHTHIVNLCMMFKYEAVCCALFGEEYRGAAEELWKVLEKYNGTAAGIFTGDECLSGLGNQQGTELCAVVELMYACEWIYAVTGHSLWAERLEKLAFNALPATFTDDMWAHQYVQQVNQVACQQFPGRSFFRTNNSEAHLFGLEPNFGCCTANMHQAWPKLLLHTLQRTEKGALVAHLLPVSVETTIKGKPVRIAVNSEYPFRMKASITVEAAEKVSFELKIRIPSWAKKVCLNGKPVRPVKGHTVIQKAWQGSETLELTMETEPRMISRPSGLKVVEYGALLFSLPIETEYRMREYEKNGVERKFPYCDYELIPKSAWNYGFAQNDFMVEERPLSDIPFACNQPAVVLHTRMAPVAWNWADGYDTVPDRKPVSAKAIGPEEEKELIPYGCAKLRMTEMPKVRR